jgi:hypothetical protein
LTNFSSITFSRTFSTPVTAVWSDNFDNGNYNDWEVLTGNFSLVTGALKGTGERLDQHRVRHVSPTAYGTWSFDLSLNTSSLTEEHLNVFFMSSIFSNSNQDGYYLTTWIDPPSRYIFSKLKNDVNTELGVYDYSTGLSRFQHIDITRDHDGHFNIFVNASLIIEAFDDSLTTSTYFGFHSLGSHAFDDVYIDDSTILWPKTTESAKLQFLESSLSVSLDQEASTSMSIIIKNLGEATGYATIEINQIPNGISINFIGSTLIKNMKSGASKQVTVSIKINSSIKPGTYNVTLSLSNSSSILDTLLLEVTVLTNGFTTSGLLFFPISFALGIIILVRRKAFQ